MVLTLWLAVVQKRTMMKKKRTMTMTNLLKEKKRRRRKCHCQGLTVAPVMPPLWTGIGSMILGVFCVFLEFCQDSVEEAHPVRHRLSAVHKNGQWYCLARRHRKIISLCLTGCSAILLVTTLYMTAVMEGWAQSYFAVQTTAPTPFNQTQVLSTLSAPEQPSTMLLSATPWQFLPIRPT